MTFSSCNLSNGIAIPIGLLLMQRLHENEHDNGDIIANCKNKNKENNADGAKLDENENENENKKLVYASIMTESDDDDGGGIELVIMPSGIANPIEISSNAIDDELYDSLVSLVKNVSGPEQTPPPYRKANATKKQNFGKHKDIEKVYQKRKTRSKRRH